MVYLLVVVAAIILIAAVAYGTQRRSRDGVASFQRQIDALSPEARKPVVDQVQSVSDLRRAAEEHTAKERAAEEHSASADTVDADSSHVAPDDSSAETDDEPGDTAHGS